MPSAFTGFAVDLLSYAAHGSLAACIDTLADQGCEAVQLSLHPGFLWPSELDGAACHTLRTLLDARGMAIAAVNLPGVEVNVASVYPEMRAYSIDILRQNLLLAADLGAPAIVLAPGRPHPLLPVSEQTLMSYFHAALDTLVPVAQGCGTGIAVENTPSSFVPDIIRLMASIAPYDRAPVGICYDMPNGHFIGEIFSDALARCAAHLKLLHVADTGREAHRHAAIGQGSIPFAELATVLPQIGFRDRPILEVISPTRIQEIEASARTLAQLGWGRRVAA